MGVVYIIHLDLLIEHLHPGLLVVGDKTTAKTNLLQPLKQPDRPLIRRRPVGNQSIVDVKDQAPEALFIQFLKINHIS